MNAALNSTVGGDPRFVNTEWGQLLTAPAGPNQTDAAFEVLYRAYAFPVYAYLRRRGRSRPDAQDLTQGFFVHLLEHHALRRADPARGRFRSFLLGALERFLADAADRERAQKRGGAAQFVFLDDDAAETRYALAAPEGLSPARLFEVRWAVALVENALARLEAEMAAEGKARLFAALKGYVGGGQEASYQQTADALGLGLGTLKSTVHRLRARYGAFLREEVSRTVADPREVDTELRHLRDVLASG